MNTIDAVLTEQATTRGGNVALICGDDRYTYGDLDAAGTRLAGALRAHGIRPGDRITYLGRDCLRYVELLFGCARAGAVLVPVSWRLTPVEIRRIGRDSTARLLFAEQDFLGAARAAATGATIVPLDDLTAWSAIGGETMLEHRSGPDDPVVQLYTSGTTGTPKGAVLAHRSFFAVRDAVAAAPKDWIHFRPDDVSVVCAPGWHVGGLWWIMQTLSAGATAVLVPTITAPTVLDVLRRHRVTTLCLPPALLTMILAEPQLPVEAFAALRQVVYGGSPISEALLKRSMDIIGCDFAQIYGLTETGNTVLCLPAAAHRRGGPLLRAAGRPYPGFAVKILGPDGDELPTGVEGEICIRTPGHMVEYWQLPEATAETLIDGWIRTGDVGHTDDEGYVYVRDRLTDLIIRAGENIYPAEIENALIAHPAVADVAVIGIPDDRWGEAAVAIIVAADEPRPSSRDLREFLRERLADYKIPSKFRFTDAIPRNSIGKILRRNLRDGYWQGRDRKVN